MVVTYDISVLGEGHFFNRARTGIARVIENLAIELSLRQDLELYLSSFQSLDIYFRTKEYLRNQKSLDSSRLTIADNLSTRTLMSLLNLCGASDFNDRQNRRLRRKLKDKFLGRYAAPGDRFLKYIPLLDVKGSDILHSPFLPFPSIRKGEKTIKRIITIYDLIPLLYPQFFKFNKSATVGNAIKRISNQDFVIAISQSTKNDLCNYSNIAPEKVFVTPLAAASMFTPCSDESVMQATRRKYGVPDVPYILSLCTLEPRKNIERTIRCFSDIVSQEKISDLNLVLVGSKGWDFDRIFAEIDQTKSLRSRIFVTGYVPDEDLSPLYSGALMFVYPSFYEGFGLPPLEAMQCGIPVITSNTSSLPEVVGDAGIMVDPTDSEAICDSMISLYKSSQLRETLSKKGLIKSQQFSWRKCSDLTAEAYAAVCSD